MKLERSWARSSISMTIYALDHLNEEEARKNSKHLFIEITVRRYPVFSTLVQWKSLIDRDTR